MLGKLGQFSLSSQQVLAVPLLAAGIGEDEVARRIGVSVTVVRKWMSEDQNFIDAVRKFSDDYPSWYREIVDNAVVKALSTVMDILEQTPRGDIRYDRIRLQAAQTILKEFGGKDGLVLNLIVPNNSRMHGEDDVYYTEGSMSVVAQRIGELPDGDDGEEDGEIIRMDPHPDATYGMVTRDGSGRFICHVCGRRVRSIVFHADNVHGMSAEEYAEMFGLPSTEVLFGETD